MCVIVTDLPAAAVVIHSEPEKRAALLSIVTLAFLERILQFLFCFVFLDQITN